MSLGTSQMESDSKASAPGASLKLQSAEKVFAAVFVVKYQSSKVKHFPFTIKECLTPTFKGIFTVSYPSSL